MSLSTCMLRELRGLGGGDVNVPVNLLTSCMLRELRGLDGGDVIVPVNLLTSCMLRELRIEAHCMQWLWRHSMTEKNH